MSDEVRADLRLVRRELDFFGSQHGYDLARRLRPAPVETHAARSPVTEQQVRRAEERRHEARGRTRVEVVRAPALEQAPLVHHADAIGQRERLLLVVCDEDGGDLQFALDFADGAAQALADLRVQCAERLVHQQDFRPVRERSRHGDTLLLAARKLRRETVVHALQGHELEQFLASRASLARLDAPDPQRELDVVADRHVTEQRVVLEDEPDLALARVKVRDVLAVQGDAAVVDVGQPGDGPQQRALAAAARPEQYEEFARPHAQRDVVDDGYALVTLRDLVEDDGHAGPSAGPWLRRIVVGSGDGVSLCAVTMR